MRWTTRLALALLLATILGVILSVQPSWSVVLTVALRAAVVLGVLALIALVLVATTKRRVRPGLVMLLASVALVVSSWSEISNSSDADQLADEIAAAGGTDIILEVIAESETNTAALVRQALALTTESNERIEPLFGDLWEESFVSVVDGPEAEDPDRLSAVAERLVGLGEEIETVRQEMNEAVDERAKEISAIETPVRDDIRLAVVEAALRHAEADRTYFEQRLDLAAVRLSAARAILSIFRDNAGSYGYDTNLRQLVFDGVAPNAAFATRKEEIEDTLRAEEALLETRAGVQIDRARSLVNAVTMTP